MLANVLMFISIAVLFMALAYINNLQTVWSNRIRWMAVIIAYLQFVMMTAVVYADSLGKSVTPFLKINMWIILLLGFGLMLMTMYMKTMSFMNPDFKDNNKW